MFNGSILVGFLQDPAPAPVHSFAPDPDPKKKIPESVFSTLILF